ncbi:DUF4329 domain-containing protein [Gymnodinialimonas ceratoperidinii]|uniref:DUF4329 domain-containing protein n=1 Tax=Gymnodinialimonas ceratoperidinii TaxID=2856823 RepID=A0A8F6TX03_9RHOB|nr:DUF4329 domain-containing protein [Gymnodinialimonas ceratoperidinii]QXT40220.1 DUF4329 domain-containing protein [Gymnodinialimonas ceratoperidinii]
MNNTPWRAAALAALLAAIAGAACAQDAAELAAARGALLQLQARSFAENVEYCGYVGRLPDGRLTATEVTRGDSWGCLSRANESRFVEIVASFHTHAGFDRGADSEVPSTNDMRGDIEERVNGYVATPGGRLWYIDYRRAEARQVCGLGCMGQDPGFVPGDAGPIAASYTYRQLQDRER